MRSSARTAIILVSVLFTYALSAVPLLGQFGQRPGPPQVRSHGNPSPRVNPITNAKQKHLPVVQKSLTPQKPPVIGFGGSNPIFPTELSYASGGLAATSVAAGDFNGDGIQDLAVANYCADSTCTSSSVNILLGNGDGTFQQAVSYSTGAYEAMAIAVGDVSQDGKLDIVVSHYCASFDACDEGVVSVLLGNGDGTFQAPIINSFSPAGYAVAIGDVNGDGIPDLVVAEADDIRTDAGYVGVFIGLGGGYFQQGIQYLSGGYGTYSLALADVDGDGKLDIVTANYCESNESCTVGTVSVLLAKNGFQYSIYSLGSYGAYSVALSDVNGDGKLDIAVANYCQSISACTNSSVAVLLGNGNGTFQSPANYVANGYGGESLAVYDVNGDGRPDLVVANYCLNYNSNCTSGGVDVLVGNGDGTFRSAVSYSSGGYEAGSVAISDVNGDSKPDVLVANFNEEFSFCGDSSVGRIPNFGTCMNDGSVAVLLGNGDGTFQADTSYQTGAAGASSVVAGDFNGDGIPDLAVSNTTTAFQSNGSVAVFLGNGDGTYKPATVYTSAGLTTSGVAVGDFNGDHILDLALVDQCSDSECSGGSVSILLGNGDGTFGEATQYLTGATLSDWVAVGDFNGDGKPDLVVSDSCGGTCGSVSVLLGNGDGSFQPAHVYTSGGIQPNFVAVGDFNNDKKLDLAVANTCADGSCTTGGLVGILLGNGDGTFQNAVGYASGGFGAQSLAIGDLNGDGKQDLAVADVSSVPGSIGILLGNGDGSFQPAQTFPVDGQPWGVAIADLNGDGKLDLAFASYERNGNDPLNGVVGTLLGNGDGTFQSAIDYGQGSLFGFSLIATDLNGDGKPDLAVVRDFNLMVFLNIVSGFQFGTTTSLISSENPAPQFQPVTFTATVAALGPGVPTGSVTFYDGSTSIGAADLNGGQPDQASVTTSSLTAGTHSISAVYAGDTNFLTSTSAILQQVITSVGPTITTQPASQTIDSGQAATLSVVATGTAPLSYQWYQGTSGDTSNPISGAASSSYTTPALTTTTSYWVQVSNVVASVNSTTATITVQSLSITTQPVSQTINSGQTATLSVVATGTAPLAYQWYQGTSGTTTNPIAGATGSSYTTPALTTSTSYWVQVSNVVGSVNSATATITVQTGPAITTQPVSQTINSGQTAALSVVATGTAPLSYQWYQGASGDTSTLISGATASSYTTPALTASTSYWVRVSNVVGSVNSATAIVTVQTPPTITTQPVGQTINSGQTVTLSVIATGTAPLSYQWYQGASGTTTNPIASAISSSYTTPALTTTTNYWVLVSNVAGSASSNTATVTVAQAPTCSPALQGTADPLTITAVANCTDPQAESLTTTINWGDGSSATTGAGGSLSASHTYPQAGTYTVVVSSTDTSELQGTASVSTTLAGAVQGPPPLTPGQSGDFPATLPPGPANVSVQFVCTSVTDSQGNVKQASDLGITCTSPVIPLSGAAQNITITISTTGPGAAKSALYDFGHRSWMTALWLPIPAIFLIGGSFGRARRSRRLISRYLLLATVGVLIGLLVACGGGFSLPQATSSTTPAGSYTVTAIDNPVNSSSTTGFVQTSLIVPLTVNPTN